MVYGLCTVWKGCFLSWIYTDMLYVPCYSHKSLKQSKHSSDYSFSLCDLYMFPCQLSVQSDFSIQGKDTSARFSNLNDEKRTARYSLFDWLLWVFTNILFPLLCMHSFTIINYYTHQICCRSIIATSSSIMDTKGTNQLIRDATDIIIISKLLIYYWVEKRITCSSFFVIQGWKTMENVRKSHIFHKTVK